MADDLADAPLVGRVPKQRLLVGDFVQERYGLGELRRKDGADVAGRDLIDVDEVVLRSLG